MTDLPEIPAPEGWHGRWPFAAEIALWIIPEKERPSALAFEIVRERGFCVEPPWLTLSDENHKRNIDGLFGTPKSFATLSACPAVTVANVAVFHRMLFAAPTEELEALRECVAEIIAARAKGRNLPVPEAEGRNARTAPFATGNLFAVRIDPKATRKAALEAFGRILDGDTVEIEKPLRGRGAFDVDALLAALALRRLRAANPFSEYWQPLAGTEFQPWAGNPPAAKIREICLEKIRHLERKHGLLES